MFKCLKLKNAVWVSLKKKFVLETVQRLRVPAALPEAQSLFPAPLSGSSQLVGNTKVRVLMDKHQGNQEC